MEKRKPVDIYQVSLYCAKCGGLMKPTNPNSDPAQYEYYCEKCGDDAFMQDLYIRCEGRK